MAVFKVPEEFTYARNAGADLSEKLHYLAHVDTDGDIVLAGDGEHCLGVITEGAVANKPVTVQFAGIAKVLVGTAVAAGAQVAADAAGKLETASTGDERVGIALTAGDADDIVPVALLSGAVP